MKTAREKAFVWMNKNFINFKPEQLDALELLLKEQDRDTRHACAEAVLGCHGPLVGVKGEAHSACMNVKAV